MPFKHCTGRHLTILCALMLSNPKGDPKNTVLGHFRKCQRVKFATKGEAGNATVNTKKKMLQFSSPHPKYQQADMQFVTNFKRTRFRNSFFLLENM